MMTTDTAYAYEAQGKKRFQTLPLIALAPVPLYPIQIALKKIVTYIVKNRPELFARLGPHKRTVYLIDPVNMPFVLRLLPAPEEPSLTAHRRREKIDHGARIEGSFLTLLKMIDGQLDGDALFFTRDIKTEGNTEAIVCLRNALDDLEGSIVDDIALACGPLSRPVNKAISFLRKR